MDTGNHKKRGEFRKVVRESRNFTLNHSWNFWYTNCMCYITEFFQSSKQRLMRSIPFVLLLLALALETEAQKNVVKTVSISNVLMGLMLWAFFFF